MRIFAEKMSLLQLVTSWKPKDFNLVSATKPCNVPKNRNPEIVPIENSRVHLVPKPGIDGSDYINATWVSGTSTFHFQVLLLSFKFSKFNWFCLQDSTETENSS